MSRVINIHEFLLKISDKIFYIYFINWILTYRGVSESRHSVTWPFSFIESAANLKRDKQRNRTDKEMINPTRKRKKRKSTSEFIIILYTILRISALDLTVSLELSSFFEILPKLHWFSFYLPLSISIDSLKDLSIKKWKMYEKLNILLTGDAERAKISVL